MPLDRNKFQRLRVINDLLARHTRPNWRTMAEACIRELGLLTNADSLRRTIFNDITDLKNAPFFAPLFSENGYYTYSEPFSLNNVLNPNDVLLLNEIQVLLRQFASLPQFKGLEEIQLKIEERAGGRRPALIEFEKNDDYTGNRHLQPLYEAISQQKALKINYKDFKDEITQHTLSPYLLREYKNRWFIFGWQHVENSLYNLALDRIQTLNFSDFAYIPSRVDMNLYLRDVVGVTRFRDALPEIIEVRFLKPRAYYVKTKALHHSQAIVSETETAIIFRYWLIPNPELETEILSYGADAEVLVPESLRKRMRGLVQEMGRGYEA
jgi:predicted DNA-binding transcriptional regulator YafY